jgi:uncharacterized protein YceK
MKRVITLVSIVAILLGGCASQKSAQNCGTKQQKKAKYHKMKSGKAPGGGMLH